MDSRKKSIIIILLLIVITSFVYLGLYAKPFQQKIGNRIKIVLPLSRKAKEKKRHYKKSFKINTFYVSTKRYNLINEKDLQKISSFNIVYDFRSVFTDQQLKELRKMNPKIKILKYLNTGHFYESMKDFNDFSQKHDDWFAKNLKSERVRAVASKAYVMEPSSQGYQNWVISWTDLFIKKGYDGIMADAFYYPIYPPFSNYYDSAPLNPATGKEYTLSEWLNAKNNLFKKVKEKLGSKLLIVNGYPNGRTYYKYGGGNLIKYVDGVWIEAFIKWPTEPYRSVSDWKKDILMLKELSATGKFIMTQTKLIKGKENDAEAEKIKSFAFNSYLLAANKNSYFELNTLDSNGWDGESINYQNYKIQLGHPLKDFYIKGSVFQRNFSKATVIVNPSKHTSKILFKKK